MCPSLLCALGAENESFPSALKLGGDPLRGQDSLWDYQEGALSLGSGVIDRRTAFFDLFCVFARSVLCEHLWQGLNQHLTGKKSTQLERLVPFSRHVPCSL